MFKCFPALLLSCLFISPQLRAQLEVSPAPEPQAFFSGTSQVVRVIFRNPGQLPIEMPLKTRLHQLSSSTVMPAENPVAWKRLTVLGGQTILESVRMNFPSVRAATKFEVRWLDEMEKTVGHTFVTVFPTNLLKQLATIAGENPPGIFDPHEQLTPLLCALKVEFVDLNEGERIETFRDRLAILGPFDARKSPPRDARKHASTLAARGVSVVLLASNQSQRVDSAVRAPVPPGPTVIVNAGHGRIVLAPLESVIGLATNALAQETLLRYAHMATNPNLLTEIEP